MSADTKEWLLAIAKDVDHQLAAKVEDLRSQGAPPRLVAAMAHALLAGGKRLRPALVIESAKAIGDITPSTWSAAIALEMIHTYSLVHDDLPAMDDDDLRRGLPTVHKAFDEATGILAGDGLLTDAFSTIAAGSGDTAGPLVAELARAAGSAGMVGGQILDMEGETRSLTQDELERVHRLKTGCLFAAGCAMGGISAGATPQQVDVLREFGFKLGLAFQVADDVLDVVADPDARGKRQGGDEERGKSTYVKLMGLTPAQDYARKVADEAATLLASWQDAERLRGLALFAAARLT